MKRICEATVVLVFLLATLPGAEASPLLDSRVAQLSTGAASWQQWDGFLTTVVKKLAEDLPEPAREQLRELLLDSRYQLVETAFSGVPNPVPSLVTDTWTRLSPILNQAVSSLPPDVSTRYKGFITTMDGVAALSGVGQRLGRQFVKKGDSMTPLASATGDVGMMQVNRHTWRGLYDLNGLAGDVKYNANAGSEILLYHLARFAIPRHEDKQPGGQLARATYSAYNGGPRQLARYRTASTIAALKKVDEAFWTKFRAVSAGQELAVKGCYGG